MKSPLSGMKLGKRGGSKPSLRMRKIKLAGRSAFPPQKTAFGPPDPLMGSPTDPMGPPVSGVAGPGETES